MRFAVELIYHPLNIMRPPTSDDNEHSDDDSTSSRKRRRIAGKGHEIGGDEKKAKQKIPPTTKHQKAEKEMKAGRQALRKEKEKQENPRQHPQAKRGTKSKGKEDNANAQ
jgi:hypothetical protein